jgi:hypothetical protein
MPRLRLLPRALDAGKEADSSHGRTVLKPSRTLSAGARWSSPLVVLPQLQVAPLAAGALVAPRRLQAPGSRAAAWPQWRGSGTPARKVAERQRRHWRRHSRLHWRIGCYRAPVRVPAAWYMAVRPIGSRTALASVVTPLVGLPLTGTSCAGRRSRGLASMPSSWCRRANSSSS